MIQILNSPIEGIVFLSSSDLEIEIKSSSGSDYYFKFFIKVNGEDYDEQGWAKYNDTNCRIQLRDLFSEILINNFQRNNPTGLYHLKNLVKRIDIFVREFNLVDNSLNEEINIPYFYVAYSQFDFNFDSTLSLRKLSLLSNKIRLTPNANFRLPIWVNSSSFSVRILSGTQELFSKNCINFVLGIYSFHFNLSDYPGYDDFRIEVSDGLNSFSQKIIVQKIWSYTISKIWFKNIYGVFEYVEFFGSVEITNSFKRKKYRLPNNNDFTSFTEKNKDFKINTGYLLPEESFETESVNLSKNIFFKYKKLLLPVIAKTTKSKQENTYNDYDDDFLILQQNGLPILEKPIDKYKIEDEIIFDADFMVLTYNFIDGKDLDTRTRIVTPDIGQNVINNYLGWGVKSDFNDVIFWGGDNTGRGKESILIDLKKIKQKYPNENKIVIDARAFWYGSVGIENVNLKVDLYKGGLMTKDGYSWINTTALTNFSFETDGKPIPGPLNQSASFNGYRLSVVTYNLVRKTINFDNFDQTTPVV